MRLVSEVEVMAWAEQGLEVGGFALAEYLQVAETGWESDEERESRKLEEIENYIEASKKDC